MENIEYEKQQPLLSVDAKHKDNIKKYKKYLVQSGTMMHFVKFLLGLRNKQMADDYVPSTDAIEMFKQYFGSLQSDTTEQDQLKVQIVQLKQQQQSLIVQINQVKGNIQKRKQQIAKALEEKRLKQQEEAKNPKKAGKK